MQKTIITVLLVLIFHSIWAQTKPTAQEKVNNANEKIKDKKAKLDSLLDKTPIGIDAGLGLKGGATVGGKTIGKEQVTGFFSETLPDLGLKLKDARRREKVRRQKKKTEHTEYEGLPILRQNTISGSGDRATVEELHVLREFENPTVYVSEIYWYDTENRRASKSVIKDKQTAQLLHGPYKRYVGGNLVEEGYYYKGTKDGRWETYDANYTLLDKSYWQRGFPAQSRITYYDSAHTKVREVIPIHFGKRKGEYLMFYEGGQMMAKGQYDNDHPIGTWTEYYQFRKQRKKETRYPRTWLDNDEEPVLLGEWDDKGKQTYQIAKEGEN